MLVYVRYDIGYVYDLTNVVGGIWIEVDYSQRGWLERPKDLDEKYNQLGLFYDMHSYVCQCPYHIYLTFGRNNLKFTVDVGTHLGYLISESAKSFWCDQKVRRCGDTPARYTCRKQTSLGVWAEV